MKKVVNKWIRMSFCSASVGRETSDNDDDADNRSVRTADENKK